MHSTSSYDISKATPGAYAEHAPQNEAVTPSSVIQRSTMDIGMLHMQYRRLRQRQKQAHIILAGINKSKIR